MDPTLEKVLLGAALAVVGFFLRWLWDRGWRRKEDGDKAKVSQEQSTSAKLTEHHSRLVVLEADVRFVKAQDAERMQGLGRVQSDVHRLDGKLDGLQTFWRTEFTKLAEKIESFENKFEQRLDAFRVELKADQNSHEDRLTGMLNEHQKRVHDRLNVLASEQAKGLTKLFNDLVEHVAEPKEPKPSPHRSVFDDPSLPDPTQR